MTTGTSIFPLLFSIFWISLWIIHFVFFLSGKVPFLEGLFEFLIVIPIGVAYFIRWLEQKRMAKKLSLVGSLRMEDGLYFLTGFSGLLAFLYFTLKPEPKLELQVLGIIGLFIGIMYWSKRRLKEWR